MTMDKSLYSAGDVADPDGATTNRAIPSDSVPNAQVMEEITTEQLYNIIKTSASRKAPGNDGIPKEFYVRTFHVIHRQLNLVINEALNGNIPQKLVEGVVVLSHKKGGNNTIKSYRPLTMLNFDYKILSRILKTRIEEIMVRHDILTPSQKCSNGKRNIFEALLAVKDRIAQIKHTYIQGTLVSFDLDHAFDRVEHSYLFRVMDDMGFNRALIQLLRTIMDHSRSRVLVNGHLSPEFEIRRSVRQGDPMSMHLFVLHLHPLLEKIRTLCNDQLDLSTAYADDISVIVVDNTKLPTLKQLFFDFGRYSGAVLNLEKTVAMNIGRSSENLPWPSMETRVKILGINFFNDHKQMIQFNWDEVIRKTTQLMWMYKARNLTLIQKVTVLNMFVTSKLWFVASVLSIRNQDIARITRLGFFLWGRQLRVPMEQICQPIAKGGLNLHLPMHKCRALLVNRFLCTIAETPFAEHLYGQVNNGGSLPATYPCLRPTWTTIRELPQQLRDNPCSSSIESHLLQALPTPKVVVNNLRASWRSVWRNVRARSLTSLEKSTFYLLVNGKLPHAALLFRQHRISNAIGIASVDPEYQELTKKILSDPQGYPDFRVVEGQIYKLVKNEGRMEDTRFCWKIYPAQGERSSILERIHGTAHLGFEKTLAALRERTCEERQRGHKFTCLRRLPSSADRIAGRATTLWPAAKPSTSWQKNPRSYRNLRPSHSSHLWPFRRKRLAAPQPSCRGDLRRLVRILHESPFEAAWPPTTTWPAANASNTP
ncbi:hypothetical protein quinque_013942 [Culex quinquefasciatus]